jgi:hypothetical protein
MEISEPGTIRAAASGKAADDGSRGTSIAIGFSSALPTIGMVAGERALHDARPAGRVQSGQQYRGFHLS